MKKTEFISFRTTKEIREKIEKEAEEKDWSLSKMVEKIVIWYIQNKAEGAAP